jgi:hypothetical protein
VNDLAQQASGFRANWGKFGFLEKPVQSGFQPVHNARICSTEPNWAESDSPVSETGGSKISKTLDETSKTMTTSLDDWRARLVRYLENPDHIVDRKVRRQALKYVMLDNPLYRWTIDGYCLNAWV